MKESAAHLRDRAAHIRAFLRTAYPDATCALAFSSPLELLVATILSAQCTDARVNMVTPALFRKYPSAKAYAAADPASLMNEIKSCGFFRAKARSITGMARRIVEHHGGRVPRSMLELVQLPGVARKTANIVLGTAFGINEGIAVDTHVRRVAQRLGLTRHDDPVKIEQDLMALVPRDEWTIFAHRMTAHGRAVCKARTPDCPRCGARAWCAYFTQRNK